MAGSTFSYETYIRATPERLWNALMTPGFLKRMWMGTDIESDWKVGSIWRATSANGTLLDSGEILENVPTQRLVIKWRNEWKPEFKAEGFSRCVYEIQPVGKSAKFTVTHSINHSDSKFIASVTGAWPITVSNLKSLLETGEVALVDNPRHSNESEKHATN